MLIKHGLLLFFFLFFSVNEALSSTSCASGLLLESHKIKGNDTLIMKQHQPCWYTGFAFGPASNKLENQEEWRINDDSGFGSKLFLGYHWSDRIFFEFSLNRLNSIDINLNEQEDSREVASVDSYVSSFHTGAFLRRSYHQWNLYGKVGVSRIFDQASRDLTLEDTSRGGFSTSIGGIWRFNSRWFSRLEYESHSDDSNMISVAIGAYIGHREQVTPVLQNQPTLLTEPKYNESMNSSIVNKKLSNYISMQCNSDHFPDIPTVYFASDISILAIDEKRKLEFFIQNLDESNDININDVFIEIHGHTDNQASETYNINLGYSRSVTVGKILVDHGIAPSHITHLSLGEGKPIAANRSLHDRAYNRRVELAVYYQGCRYLSHESTRACSSNKDRRCLNNGEPHHSDASHHESVTYRDSNKHNSMRKYLGELYRKSVYGEKSFSAHNRPKHTLKSNNNMNGPSGVPHKRFIDLYERNKTDQRIVVDQQLGIDGGRGWGGYQDDWRPLDDNTSNIKHPLTLEEFGELQ